MRISPANNYLLLCRLNLVTDSYFGNFVVLPIDLTEILRLVDQRRLFGEVWILDKASRASFGLNASVPTFTERLQYLAKRVFGQ